MTTIILSVCLSVVAAAITSAYYNRKTMDMVLNIWKDSLRELTQLEGEDNAKVQKQKDRERL